jgi:amino acid transporter
MGLGFVILIHLIVLFILAAMISGICGIIVFIKNRKKEQRKRKTFLAIICPFIFLYTFYFCLLIGGVIISETKKVDIGIGDTWYAPINDTCRIVMIDLPNMGYIECNDKVVVNSIIKIDQVENSIVGQNSDLKFFIFDLQENKLDYYATEQELIINEYIDSHTLVDVEEFQSKLYKKAIGNLMIYIPILSLIISALSVVVVRKLFLFVIKKIAGTKTSLNH